MESTSGQMRPRKDYKLHQFYFADDAKVNSYANKEYFDYFNAGKQLRARLTNAFGSIIGVEEEKLDVISRAVEMIHNATLTHDDVIDQSSLRRQSETVNKTLGNKKSVLVGDYLLAKALTELSVLNSPPVMREVSFCLKTLVDGEWFQMEVEGPYDLTLDDYLQLAICKTGSLFAVCFTCPFYLKSQNEESIEVLKQIGHLLGSLFQIKDDLSDFVDNPLKTPYLDFKNNNPNMLLSLVGKHLSTEQKHLLMGTDDFRELETSYKNIFAEAKQEVYAIQHDHIDLLHQKVQLFSSLNPSLNHQEVMRFFNKIEASFTISSR